MSDTQGAARGIGRIDRIRLVGTHTMDAAATSILEDDAGVDISIPYNAFNIFLSGIVTTAITGPGASFTIGDGTDADRYGTGITIAAATTFANSDYTAGGLDGTSHAVIVAAGAAHTITFTGTGANFTGGVVDWSLSYDVPTELTAALP